MDSVFAARRAAPSAARLHLARLVSFLVILAGLNYLFHRWWTVGVTGVFGAILFAVECVAFTVLVVSAVLLARVARRSSVMRGAPSGSLDVFVTVCGEPLEMVERTLLAALAIEYPHRTFLLNDSHIAGMPGWEAIEALASRHHVRCFTRTDGCRGKAGNLNHALRRTTGEFVATIDADHLASPDLAAETLGYFVEPAWRSSARASCSRSAAETRSTIVSCSSTASSNRPRMRTRARSPAGTVRSTDVRRSSRSADSASGISSRTCTPPTCSTQPGGGVCTTLLP